jgi:hypothetical protein
MTLSTWVRKARCSDCTTFSNLAEGFLSATLPTDLPSSTTNLSDILTSLTLDYHSTETNLILISQPLSDIWVCMDEFLAKYFTALEILSVNIDFYLPENYDMVQIDSLIGTAENSFPRLNT